jgi:hypothetical protein
MNELWYGTGRGPIPPGDSPPPAGPVPVPSWRVQLVYGELRQKRRTDARERLRTAHRMLAAMA